MINYRSMAKRQKYDPRCILLLIEKAAEKAGVQTNSAALIQLATDISSSSDKKTMGFGEKYLDKLYTESKKAISRNNFITKEDTKINTILTYCGHKSYEEFYESISSELAKVSFKSEHISVKIRRGNFLDKYDRVARIYPASIALFPLLITLNFIVLNKTTELLWIVFFEAVSIIAFIPISIIFANLTAGLSKLYQKKYFRDGMSFPTTSLMLYKDPVYSDEYKDAFREKVKRLFNLSLASKEQEKIDEIRAVQSLNAAIEYVKQFIYEGLVHTQNIRYGFMRNFVGASIFGLTFSLLSFIAGIVINSGPLLIISTAFVILFGAILIFKKHLIYEAAEAYAKELLANFLKN